MRTPPASTSTPCPATPAGSPPPCSQTPCSQTPCVSRGTSPQTPTVPLVDDSTTAIIALNSRIRIRDFCSHEILFSREQMTGDNIKLDDKNLKEKMEKKSENHKYSEKSKFPSCAEPLDAKAAKGDFVHLKDDGDKHNLRDTYIVLSSKKDLLTLVKLLHSLDRNESTKLSSRNSM